jgi:hypothetical protein
MQPLSHRRHQLVRCTGILLAQLALVTSSCVLAGGCAGQITAPDRLAAGRTHMFARDIESARRAGTGPSYRPPSHGFRTRHGLPVDGMSCRARSRGVSAAHIELFAHNRVVIVPAGIGLMPPLRIRGAFVRGWRCAYPLRTMDPTGLVLLDRGGRYTLGDLFDLWGQPLSRTLMASFRVSAHENVSVFINGRLWMGDPRKAPVVRHAQVTIEVGAPVRPHSSYVFPSLAWTSS